MIRGPKLGGSISSTTGRYSMPPLDPDTGKAIWEVDMDYVGEVSEVEHRQLQASLNEAMFRRKLAERLSFARRNVENLKALIGKCRESADPTRFERLERLLRDEERHVAMLLACCEEEGADDDCATSEHYVAVLVGGVAQIMNSSRATLESCFQAVLAAELLDNEGWDLLTKLASITGRDHLAEKFESASDDEFERLQHLRRWHEDLVLGK